MVKPIADYQRMVRTLKPRYCPRCGIDLFTNPGATWGLMVQGRSCDVVVVACDCDQPLEWTRSVDFIEMDYHIARQHQQNAAHLAKLILQNVRGR
jgi:hypothetical protein